MNYNELYRVFRNTYRTLDMRYFLLRKDKFSQWECIFLKIKFSKDSVGEVTRQHQLIDPNLQRGNDKFRLGLIAKDLNYYPVLVENFKRNSIKINGIRANFDLADSNVGSQNINTYTMYDKDIEYKSWFAYFENQNSASVQSIVEENGSVMKELGMRYSDISQWFNINENEWITLRCKLLICFPIYIRQKTITNNSELREHAISYYIHGYLTTKINTVSAIIEYRGIINKEARDLTLLSTGSTNTTDMTTRTIIIKERAVIQNLEFLFYIDDFEIPLYVDKIFSRNLYT